MLAEACIELRVIQETPLGKKVRLRYSITINYLSRMLALLMNIIFAVIVARKLSLAEFGLWVLLSKYLTYIIFLIPIYGVWTPRAISRGWNVSKTTLFIALLLGSATSLMSIFALYYILGHTQLLVEVVLLFAVIIFEEYLSKGFLHILSGYRPHYWGYYLVVFSTLRVITVYIALVVFRLGLIGLILSVIFSRLISISFLFISSFDLLRRSNLDINLVKIWLGRSWYPLALSLAGLSMALDVFIVNTFVGGYYIIACYGVIFFMINFVGSVSQYTVALSARILAERDKKHTYVALWTAFFFTIPLVTILLALTEPIIAIFGVEYTTAAVAARFFIIGIVFRLIYAIFKSTMLSWEQADFDVYKRFSIIKTSFSKVLAIEAGTTLMYLIGILAMSILIVDPLAMLLVWGVIFLLKFLIGSFMFDLAFRRHFGEHLFDSRTIKIISKFMVFSVPVYLIGINIRVTIKKQFFAMLSSIAPLAIGLLLLNYVIIILLDKEARLLIRKVWKVISMNFS